MKYLGLIVIAYLFIAGEAFSQTKLFEMQRVADGIFAFVSSDPTKDIVNGNSVAIICTRGVVVFDANSTPGEARAVLAEIRKLTDKPVRYVVNSHWHWDHWLGNQVYKEAFPDCEIISSSETRRIIETRFQRFYKSEMEGSDELIRTFKEELNKGKKKNGDSLTNYEKIRWAQTIQDAEFGFAEEKNLRYTPPTMVFEQGMTLFMGDREIRIQNLGPGNTTGDAFVYLPKEKILLTGDLLVSPVPYAFGVTPRNWIRILKAFDEMDVTTIIPGHGAVQYNKDYLKAVIEMFESITDQVTTHMKNGAGKDDLKSLVNVENFRKKFADTDPAKNYVFDLYFVKPFVDRAFKETQGEIGQ